MLIHDSDIPIFLVSLQSDTSRRNKLQKIFPFYFPKMIHVKAVDGSHLSAKEYYQKTIGYFMRTRKIMTPGELGCTLSHLYALELFLKSANQYALILEDDVIGADENIDQIFTAARQLDERSLFICGAQNGNKGRKNFFGKLYYEKPQVYLLSKLSYPYILRTCCYVVTRKSAKIIVESHRRNITIADEWYFLFKRSDIKIYYSDILLHDQINSSSINWERQLKKKQESVISRKLNRKKRKYIRLTENFFLANFRGYVKF